MVLATVHRKILAAAGAALVALVAFLATPANVVGRDDDKENYKWTEPKGAILAKDVRDTDTVLIKGNTWRFNNAFFPKNKYYRLTTSPCMNEYVPKKDVIVVSFHISEVVSFKKIGMGDGKDTWDIRVKKHK